MNKKKELLRLLEEKNKRNKLKERRKKGLYKF